MRTGSSTAKDTLLMIIGILVAAMATEMSISSKMAPNRVRKPSRSNDSQAISTTPTNGPVKSGNRMPVLANRPVPHLAARRNFLIPSVKNAPPTSNRIRTTAGGASVRSRPASYVSCRP